MLASRKDAVKLLTRQKVAQNRKSWSKVAQVLPSRICLGLHGGTSEMSDAGAEEKRPPFLTPSILVVTDYITSVLVQLILNYTTETSPGKLATSDISFSHKQTPAILFLNLSSFYLLYPDLVFNWRNQSQHNIFNQKGVVLSICNASFRANSTPLFAKLNLLDIYKISFFLHSQYSSHSFS